MAMVVKNNMSAVSTLNTLNKNSSALQKSLSKVSSGMKINSAQDDASGYAISERMRVQIRSLDQANQNTQNGSSMMKTAEGAVSSTVEILKSLKEKAINAANDTNKDADRTTIQKEIDQFIDQIDDNALTTFNGKYLVDGSKAQQGNATYTAMTNQSLAKDTVGTDKLTALKNRNNESLEIESTDYVTASFVKDGNTYTTKFQVGTDTDLNKVFGELNKLTDANGKMVNPFGPAQTTTQKMSLEEAGKVITALKNTDGKAAKLFNIASGGTEAGTGDITTIDKDVLAQAVATLTAEDDSGKAASTTAEILTALGSNTGKELPDAKTSLEGALRGKWVAAGVAQVTFKNSGTDSTTKVESGTVVNAAVQTKLYDANGSESTGVAYTQAFSTTATGAAMAANTGTAQVAAAAVSTDEARSRQEFADSVMKSIDNLAALNAKGNTTKTIDTGYVNGVTGASAGTVAQTTVQDYKMAAGNSSDVSISALAQTVSAGSAAATDVEFNDYSTAYAFNAALSGNLANGNTSAIGLMASGDLLSTANGEEGVTVTARNAGVAGQISGVTISISDSQGNVKKAANASLDNFSTSNFAKNRSDANELSFQVGANANQAIAVGLEDMRSEALGLKGSDGSKVSVATQDKANAAIAVFDNAIQKALDQQTTIGSIEARLAYTSENLTVSSENTQAAESTIRDADMAKEMTNYTKNNVLLQAAQSMLAQANQSSSAVLSLLQ